MTNPTTVCGRAKYHEGRHGSWTKNGAAEGWQCRATATPRTKLDREGVWTCLECYGKFKNHTQAAQHWWRSHVRLRKLAAIKHGTESGYHAHLRRDETTCQPCRDAHAAHARGDTK